MFVRDQRTWVFIETRSCLISRAKVESDYPINKIKKIQFENRINKNIGKAR